MNRFVKWYGELSPSQQLALKVTGVIVWAFTSAVVNQKIGARRGYAKGYSKGHVDGHTIGYDKGMAPLKQAELDRAHIEGWKMGCSDGVQFSRPTIITQVPERDAFSEGFDFELGRSLIRPTRLEHA